MCLFLELHFLHSISHILQIISHIAYSTFHIFNYNSFCIIYIPQIICLLHHVSHISCSMHSIFNTSFLIFRDFASHISYHTYFERLTSPRFSHWDTNIRLTPYSYSLYFSNSILTYTHKILVRKYFCRIFSYDRLSNINKIKIKLFFMHVKINVFTVEFILYVFGTKICLFYLYFYYSLYNTRCNICF